jgi:cell wall-associated NlpC family hydrolase
MKHRALFPVLACLLIVWVAFGAPQSQPGKKVLDPPSYWTQMKKTIEGYLGRPYAWGATGLKSFDCSGFVWRVISDNGYLLKRTTARKLYFSLPAPAPDTEWNPGNIVFFDDLRHCGIVNSKETFYHAQSSKGTNLSPFSPYWGPKVVGVRCLADIK